MSSFDSFWFIYKNSFGNWDMCTNPKFIARYNCRAIYKSKVRDFKQLRYVCKKLNSYQDTFRATIFNKRLRNRLEFIMKVAENIYEYWIHKYKYSSEHKRNQFKRLLEAGKVTKVKNKEYSLSQHYVYRSEVPVKLCRG